MSSLLESLLQSMDQVAIRHLTEGKYVVMHQFNPWFAQFYPEANMNPNVTLRGASEFLDNFLHDAASHWARKKTDPLKSGPFLETGRDGVVYPLEATAITVDGDRLLILANLGESYERTLKLLQAARNNLLIQESLEVEVSKRTQEIRDRESEISARLIFAAGFRDEETSAHTKRIGLYSAEMARALGWTQSKIDDIRSAAPMHDIGKIGIPDSILRKPGKLTPDEFETMKGHAQLGIDMLGDSAIDMVKMAADIAGAHHEHYDGDGYPAGLKGQDIPESARIVAIVDVYDALVHQRVYKDAIFEDEAIAMMREQSGKQFDPELLDLFILHLEAMRSIRQDVRD